MFCVDIIPLSQQPWPVRSISKSSTCAVAMRTRKSRKLVLPAPSVPAGAIWAKSSIIDSRTRGEPTLRLAPGVLCRSEFTRTALERAPGGAGFSGANRVRAFRLRASAPALSVFCSTFYYWCTIRYLSTLVCLTAASIPVNYMASLQTLSF